jgi:hypothetical protein
MSILDFFRRNNDNKPAVKSSPKSAIDAGGDKSISVTNPLLNAEESTAPEPGKDSSKLEQSTINPLFLEKHGKDKGATETEDTGHDTEEHTAEKSPEPRMNIPKKRGKMRNKVLKGFGKGLLKYTGLGLLGKGTAYVARAAGRGIKAGAISVGKKMGIGLTEEEKKTSELNKANPNFDERFGTNKKTNEIIGGVGSGLGVAGTSTGIALVAERVLKNTDATKFNASGGASILGGAVGLGLGALGIKKGSDRLDRAKASGDKAGESLAIDQIATNSVGLTKGALSTASAGVKFAAAAKDIGLGAAKGAISGLGAATGALTIAEGLFKGGIDAKHLHKTRTYVPVSKKGIDWRSHIVKKKAWRVGINALKVVGGALGVAGSVLTGGATAIGLAAASAVIGIGSSVVKMGKGIANRRKMAAGRKEMFRGDAVGDGKSISESNIDKANKLRSNAKVSKTGSIANEMIEAVKKFDEGKYKSIQSAHIVSQETPSIKDKIASVLTWGAPRAQAKENKAAVKVKNAEAKEQLTKFDENDKQVYDANEILSAIGVSREEATSASGQELIEKKVSVTNSL